jgi:hypothetical protein
MNTKLTLSIDAEVVATAKRLARQENTSVSAMVEAFLVRKSGMEGTRSVVHTICANAPAAKTPAGTEKEILKRRLNEKHGA